MKKDLIIAEDRVNYSEDLETVKKWVVAAKEFKKEC